LLTNGGGGGRIRARELSVAERACGGLSNGVDGEGGDAWPKVIQGRAELQSILDQMVVPPLGGPEIADDAAGSLLAEQLIELLTYVTSSFSLGGDAVSLPNVFMFCFSSLPHTNSLSLFVVSRSQFFFVLHPTRDMPLPRKSNQS
jgi:hypothetical protein